MGSSSDIAGPQRGCHVAHEQDSTGQGAPFTPGTVVRSRPATTLRPAPAAFERPVPTAPLTHPIGGGHLHEASSGVYSRSPITPRRPDAAPEPGSTFASRRSSPRPQPPDGTGTASAFTPGFAPRSYPQSTPGRRQALTHWPEYYTYGINRTSKRCLLLHSCTLMSHPAVGRFQHHLGVRPGPLELQAQRDRIVEGPHRRQLLPGFGLAHDHRALSMQIDPNELPTLILVHRGLPWFVEVTPPAFAGNVTRSGGPAPSSHHNSSKTHHVLPQTDVDSRGRSPQVDGHWLGTRWTRTDRLGRCGTASGADAAGTGALPALSGITAIPPVRVGRAASSMPTRILVARSRRGGALALILRSVTVRCRPSPITAIGRPVSASVMMLSS